MAIDSMHHAPSDILEPEYEELLRHLKVGGAGSACVPKEQVGLRQTSLQALGPKTDGPGTPWAEPYDLEKLLSMFEPARFDVVLYQEFHNSDFNWFDLLYRGT